ncbi:MAG: hypothetical protein IJ812_06045, partial [Schwartzia sp.]|nr:hypothetical protein [Schwartzia sp. (in: firmicutes)]
MEIVTDAEIRRVANEASYRRGCAYQRDGAVTITKRVTGRGSFDYEAEVKGSGPFAYFVTASIAG